MAETMELQDSAVDRLDGKEQLSKDEEKYLNELKEKVDKDTEIVFDFSEKGTKEEFLELVKGELENQNLDERQKQILQKIEASLAIEKQQKVSAERTESMSGLFKEQTDFYFENSDVENTPEKQQEFQKYLEKIQGDFGESGMKIFDLMLYTNQINDLTPFQIGGYVYNFLDAYKKILPQLADKVGDELSPDNVSNSDETLANKISQKFEQYKDKYDKSSIGESRQEIKEKAELISDIENLISDILDDKNKSKEDIKEVLENVEGLDIDDIDLESPKESLKTLSYEELKKLEYKLSLDDDRGFEVNKIQKDDIENIRDIAETLNENEEAKQELSQEMSKQGMDINNEDDYHDFLRNNPQTVLSLDALSEAERQDIRENYQEADLLTSSKGFSFSDQMKEGENSKENQQNLKSFQQSSQGKVGVSGMENMSVENKKSLLEISLGENMLRNAERQKLQQIYDNKDQFMQQLPTDLQKSIENKSMKDLTTNEKEQILTSIDFYESLFDTYGTNVEQQTKNIAIQQSIDSYYNFLNARISSFLGDSSHAKDISFQEDGSFDFETNMTKGGIELEQDFQVDQQGNLFMEEVFGDTNSGFSKEKEQIGQFMSLDEVINTIGDIDMSQLKNINSMQDIQEYVNQQIQQKLQQKQDMQLGEEEKYENISNEQFVKKGFMDIFYPDYKKDKFDRNGEVTKDTNPELYDYMKAVDRTTKLGEKEKFFDSLTDDNLQEFLQMSSKEDTDSKGVFTTEVFRSMGIMEEVPPSGERINQDKLYTFTKVLMYPTEETVKYGLKNEMGIDIESKGYQLERTTSGHYYIRK